MLPYSFLLTRPLRDVTVSYSHTILPISISTHTPLAGRDPAILTDALHRRQFLLTRPLRDVTSLELREDVFS